MFNKFSHLMPLATCIVFLTSCGTVVPQISEVWEGRDVDDNMAFNIKKKIFCELATAIKNTNDKNAYIVPNRPPIPALPDDYGVQMQTTLTIEESSSLNPSVTLNRTLPSGFAAGVTNIGQSFNIAFGGTASTTATRTDTAYSYFLVGKIGKGQEIPFCNDKDNLVNTQLSSPLIRSDLKIEDFLVANTKGNAILHSSSGGNSKSAKLDIFTYDIKFTVLTNANINPTWKLVPVSGGGNMPFATTGRTRTHDLILTFGPNAEKGFEPSLASLNQNLSANFRAIAQGIRPINQQGF